MLGLERSQIIDVLINNYPQVICLLVGGDIGGREDLGHGGQRLKCGNGMQEKAGKGVV